MISYLSGKVIAKKENFVILDVQGVGYEVFVSKPCFDILPEKGAVLNMFCYLDVTERSLKLFGFLTYDELELFKVVRSISGVGPKAALEISSVGSLERIKEKIDKDKNVFEGVSGIGQKRAQKIVLELSGKLKISNTKQRKQNNELENDEAFNALINLGFSKEQVKQVLQQLAPEIKDPQEKVKKCLQILGK